MLDDKCKVIKGLLVVRRYIGDMHILNIISQGRRPHIYKHSCRGILSIMLACQSTSVISEERIKGSNMSKNLEEVGRLQDMTVFGYL